MSANGEQQHPLLPDPAEDIGIVIMRFEPRWSADGQSILFDAYTWAWDAPKTYRLHHYADWPQSTGHRRYL